MAPYDIIGNVVIVKFPKGTSITSKKAYASRLLKQTSVSTVVEKVDKIKGRLRTPTTKYLAGVKTKEALYKENGCEFRLNIDTCYFSPRLASERKDIAQKVKKKEHVLVMFGGVGPFAVVIAKQARPAYIATIELGRAPHAYALENIKRNKVSVDAFQGDVRKVVPKLKRKFDRIVMARPRLEDSFLDVAFKAIKSNGTIHYYGFYHEDEVSSLKELIASEAKKAKKKVRIGKLTKAGDIGTRMYRYRVDITLVN